VLFRAGPPAQHESVALAGIGATLADGKSFFFGDFQAPISEELDALAEELKLHPLAIEDVRHRHQRPRIDVYADHFFLVCYQIASVDKRVVLEEVDVFIAPNYLVACHDGEAPLLSEVLERFRRQSGPHDVSGLLYEVLDAILDGMNFRRLAGAADGLFPASIAAIVALPLAMLAILRRQGIR